MYNSHFIYHGNGAEVPITDYEVLVEVWFKVFKWDDLMSFKWKFNKVFFFQLILLINPKMFTFSKCFSFTCPIDSKLNKQKNVFSLPEFPKEPIKFNQY